MKRITPFVSILLLLLVSCQDKESMARLEELNANAALEEQNRALVEKYIKSWNTWDSQAMDEYLDPQFKIYIPSNTTNPMVMKGYKAWIDNIFRNFPDIQYEIQDILAKGDRVVVRWNCSASINANDPDDPDLTKQITASAIEIFRVKEGKITEERTEMDAMGWTQQMGQ